MVSVVHHTDFHSEQDMCRFLLTNILTRFEVPETFQEIDEPIIILPEDTEPIIAVELFTETDSEHSYARAQVSPLRCSYNQVKDACVKIPACKLKCGESTPFYCFLLPCVEQPNNSELCGCPMTEPYLDTTGKCHTNSKCPRNESKVKVDNLKVSNGSSN
jgi:hypothetical protein